MSQFGYTPTVYPHGIYPPYVNLKAEPDGKHFTLTVRSPAEEPVPAHLRVGSTATMRLTAGEVGQLIQGFQGVLADNFAVRVTPDSQG